MITTEEYCELVNGLEDVLSPTLFDRLHQLMKSWEEDSIVGFDDIPDYKAGKMFGKYECYRELLKLLREFAED